MFADVQVLLATSRPRPRPLWLIYAIGAGIMTIFVLFLPAGASQDQQQAYEVIGSILALVLLGGMSLTTLLQTRSRRAEVGRLEAAEELIQLRRWPQAAMLLQSILSRPAGSQQTRLQALASFIGVLLRFHRFDDVLTVTDHLLKTLPLDSAAVHAVRLSRAMSLLREDRLFDADQAISELRRSREAASSGGLALLELYRDAKTGHAREALESFKNKREMIRRQFGHRLADGYILAALAHDQLNDFQSAGQAYRTATLLAPAVELHRRYPETATLAGKYSAEPAPAEVIG